MSSSDDESGIGMYWPVTSAGGVHGAAFSSSSCSSSGRSLGSGMALLGLGARLCAATSDCAGVIGVVLGALLGGALKGIACPAVHGCMDCLSAVLGRGGAGAGGCLAMTCWSSAL